MPSKLDILRRLADAKNAFILDSLEALDKKVKAGAGVLLQLLIDDFISSLDVENGEIKSEGKNITRVSLIDSIWQKWQDTKGVQIFTAFVTDLDKIITLGKDYYTTLIPTQPHSAAIEKILNQKLGISWNEKGAEWTPKKNGYLDSLIKDVSIKNEIKTLSFNSILSRAGPKAMRQSLGNYLTSIDEKRGALNTFFDQFVYDTYSEIDRQNAQLHADRLNLQYFIYNGGLVLDSREFCKERNGKCFSTEEAEEWKNLIGKTRTVPGKKKGTVKKIQVGPIGVEKETYEPIQQLGGIRCRHLADFVSDEIAETLRK